MKPRKQIEILSDYGIGGCLLGEMSEASDAQLLREYVEHGNEAAFREIVVRHTDAVYAAALRQVLSPDLARDVAQSVFTDLARKAPSLLRTLDARASLLGWLYRSTRFAALNQWRDDHRRQARERLAMQNFDPAPDPAPEWERIGPVLDEAMSQLGDEDRESLLLRFFQSHDFRAIGQSLGVERLQAEYGLEAANNLESRRRTMRGFKIAHGKLGQSITKAMQEVSLRDKQRAALPKRIPLQDLPGEPVVKLAPERKHLTNLLKMVAYQAESDLLRAVTPYYSRADDEGRTLIQSALANDADLQVTEDELRVTLAPLSSPHRTRAIAALCEELNQTVTIFPGSRLRLHYAVRESP